MVQSSIDWICPSLQITSGGINLTYWCKNNQTYLPYITLYDLFLMVFQNFTSPKPILHSYMAYKMHWWVFPQVMISLHNICFKLNVWYLTQPKQKNRMYTLLIDPYHLWVQSSCKCTIKQPINQTTCMSCWTFWLDMQLYISQILVDYHSQIWLQNCCDWLWVNMWGPIWLRKKDLTFYTLCLHDWLHAQGLCHQGIATCSYRKPLNAQGRR